MSAFKLSLAVALLVSGTALAQTTPSTSTTSGPISGSGATTSGTVPGNVGPVQYTTKAYRQEMRNDRATNPRRNHKKSSMKVKTVSPDGEKMKTNM